MSESGPKDAVLSIAVLPASVLPSPSGDARSASLVGHVGLVGCGPVNVSYMGTWPLGTLWALGHFQDLLTKVSVDNGWWGSPAASCFSKKHSLSPLREASPFLLNRHLVPALGVLRYWV